MPLDAAALAGAMSKLYDDSHTAEFYDYVVPYRERADVPFYVEMAKASGGDVLELGCGSGRILIPTARAGIPICGLDASAAMLARCREKLRAETPDVRANVELHRDDMRNFRLDRFFRLVTIPFRGFQHLLEPADQIACLEAVHRSLSADGRLVFDVFDPDLARLVDETPTPETVEPEFTMPDGRRVVRSYRQRSRDYARQIIEVEFIYRVRHPDGREGRLTDSFPMRYFFRFEVEHLLARSGFRVDQVYADFDRRLHGAGSVGELIFIATRT